jgi:hypothetical protein
MLSEFPGSPADNSLPNPADRDVKELINNSSALFPLLVHIFYTTLCVTKNDVTHPIDDVEQNISTEIPVVSTPI